MQSFCEPKAPYKNRQRKVKKVKESFEISNNERNQKTLPIGLV